MPRSSLRSLRSAAIAVGVTGVLSISIPLALLFNIGGLSRSVAASSPVLASRLLSCGSEHALGRQVLRPEQCVLVQLVGFGQREQVRVRELNRPGWSQLVQADRVGQLSYRFQLDAGAKMGPDVLIFVGMNGGSTHDSASTSAVPRVGFCRFTVIA
ncbi:MAG: hypothetical protein ACR2N4_15725 [Jatrophihabitans sp.]